MSKYIKLEDAKVAIREKFKSIEDRVEINSVLNGLPTLNITEYADKHQAYSEGYAKGVVYGGLLKSEVSEDCSDYYKGYCARHEDGCFYQCKNAPSVVPKWCIGEVDCPYVIDEDAFRVVRSKGVRNDD